jgi:hypothetical protein
MVNEMTYKILLQRKGNRQPQATEAATIATESRTLYWTELTTNSK